MRTLEKHCEMARDYIRQIGKIPPIPTIDRESLNNYAELVKVETPASEEVKAAATTPAPAKKRTTAKKTTNTTAKTTTKKTTKAKAEQNGNDKEVKANDEVPAHE